MPSKPNVLTSWLSTGAQRLTTATGASAQFTSPMAQGAQYVFTCESDCWVTVAATGGAAQADTAGNYFVKSGTSQPLCNLEDSGTTNSFVHVIAQAAAGAACLVPVAERIG